MNLVSIFPLDLGASHSLIPVCRILARVYLSPSWQGPVSQFPYLERENGRISLSTPQGHWKDQITEQMGGSRWLVRYKVLHKYSERLWHHLVIVLFVPLNPKLVNQNCVCSSAGPLSHLAMSSMPSGLGIISFGYWKSFLKCFHLGLNLSSGSVSSDSKVKSLFQDSRGFILFFTFSVSVSVSLWKSSMPIKKDKTMLPTGIHLQIQYGKNTFSLIYCFAN